MTGIVLAGGKSSRFGSDKGLFPYQGKPLVEHAIDILRQNFPTLIVSTNNPDAYAYLNLPMVSDTYPDCGPIGGIYSALANGETLRGEDFTRGRLYEGTTLREDDFTRGRLYEGTTLRGGDFTREQKREDRNVFAVISSDTPHVPPALYAFMLEHLGDHDAVVPVHDGFKETTCAIYTTGCLSHLEQAIKHKRYKILDALKQVNTLFLNVTTADFYREGMFYNINYLRDIRQE